MLGTYGVRAFADYVPRQRLDDADFFDALSSWNWQPRTASPYNLVARYLQMIAHKSTQH